MSTTPLERYTETSASEHDADKRTIARILTNDHRGRYWYDEDGERHDNTISSTELAEHTRCGASTVRDLIPKIRREYKLPIGSSNGYFVIETKEEYARQVERQIRQAETSRQTARDISSAFNTANGEL
jgi:hypothetical protein